MSHQRKFNWGNFVLALAASSAAGGGVLHATGGDEDIKVVVAKGLKESEIKWEYAENDLLDLADGIDSCEEQITDLRFQIQRLQITAEFLAKDRNVAARRALEEAPPPPPAPVFIKPKAKRKTSIRAVSKPQIKVKEVEQAKKKYFAD